MQSCTTTARPATTLNTKQMQLGLDHRSAASTHIFCLAHVVAGHQPLKFAALVVN